jgi:apolipoprotein N-acyltransferase
VSFALVVALVGHAGWLAEAGETYFDLPRSTAVAAAVGLCVACAVPMGALLGLGLGCAAALPRSWSIPGSAAVWVAWESLTRIAFPSYPWVGLAATQAEVSTVLQAASVGGQGGLSFVLAAAGSAIGRALGASWPAPRTGAARSGAAWPLIGIAAALAVATPLLGAARLRNAPAEPSPLCSIAAVDARIPGPSLPPAEVVARHAAVAERAAAGRPDAIVWPESALPRDPLLDGDLLRRLRELSAGWRTVILAGGPRSDWGPDWALRRFNSVFRIAGSQPVETYDKREPVPFAEAWPAYVPKPRWIASDEISAGGPAGPLQAGDCRIGILVCFEAERPALARELAASGADAIVVASNDAELPRRAIAVELAEARLRAVETGLPVLRAANAGASVAIDRYGRDVGRPEDGIVRLRVPPSVMAPAVRWASPLVALCWAAAVLVVVRAFRVPRSR